MPRTSEANRRIRDERRERILAVARQVFWRTGLAATKISDIAAAAGVSYGLVYHYFPSKEAIYAAVVESALAGAAREIAAARAAGSPPWERLRALCATMLAGIREAPEYPLLILQAMTSETVPTDVRSALARYAPTIAADMRTLIVEGQVAGQIIPGDPDALTDLFLATINGLAVRRLFPFGAEAPFPDVEMVLRLLQP